MLVVIDDLDEDDVLEELLLAIDEVEDIEELAKLLELVLLKLEVKVTVVFVHLILCHFPLLSPYSYSEHGFMGLISTLLTYAVKGPLVMSLYPPAQFAVAGLLAGSPAFHTPRWSLDGDCGY